MKKWFVTIKFNLKKDDINDECRITSYGETKKKGKDKAVSTLKNLLNNREDIEIQEIVMKEEKIGCSVDTELGCLYAQADNDTSFPGINVYLNSEMVCRIEVPDEEKELRTMTYERTDEDEPMIIRAKCEKYLKIIYKNKEKYKNNNVYAGIYNGLVFNVHSNRELEIGDYIRGRYSIVETGPIETINYFEDLNLGKDFFDEYKYQEENCL